MNTIRKQYPTTPLNADNVHDFTNVEHDCDVNVQDNKMTDDDYDILLEDDDNVKNDDNDALADEIDKLNINESHEKDNFKVSLYAFQLLKINVRLILKNYCFRLQFLIHLFQLLMKKNKKSCMNLKLSKKNQKRTLKKMRKNCLLIMSNKL